jgi:hypothetical protein
MSRFGPYLHAVAVGAAAVGIGVTACGQGGSGGGGTTRVDAVELASLEAANTPGTSPWTESVTAADPPQQVNRVEAPEASRTVSGDQMGLYGGSTNRVVCDRDRLVSFLEQNPAKAAAWRSVTRIDDLRSYILGLSPVFLTQDTSLTNHGFEDGAATAFPAVLQTGTAVLVDNRGLPRVRCDSGSPLSEPRGELTDDDLQGTGWQNLDVESIVEVLPSQEAVTDLKVIPVANDGEWAPPMPMPTGLPAAAPILSIDIGDALAAAAPDTKLPPDVTLQTVDVASNLVTTTDPTTITATTTPAPTDTTTDTPTTEPTPTTSDEVVIEPTDSGPIDTGTEIEPGGIIVEPTP